MTEKPPQHSRGHRDSSTVHAALELLGAPRLEAGEFARLYRGSLADVLFFVTEHMQGRRQVALARAEIHQLQELRSKLHLRPHLDDTTRSAAEKASLLLSERRQTVETYGRQMDTQQAVLDEAQARIYELEKKLKRAQEINFLLNILEQKENLRLRRFQDMTEMLGDLRKAVEAAKIKFTSPSFLQQGKSRICKSLSAVPRPLRIYHTRNALSNVHAYHIRLSLIAKRQHGLSSELIERLRQAIARQTGRAEADLQTSRLVDQCTSVACRRATQSIENQNHCLREYSPIMKPDLENAMLQVRRKEQELRRLSNLSLALGFLCEHFISSISIFLERTSHVLRASLQEEAPLTKAHIDVLRCLIASSPSGKSDRQIFTRAVSDTCKIRGGTPDEIIEQVERLITNACRQRSFLASSIPSLPSLTLEQDSVAAKYMSDTERTQERAVKLLTRKIEKAGFGYSLVNDIEAFLQETRIIIG